jgi:hypothetical protein
MHLAHVAMYPCSWACSSAPVVALTSLVLLQDKAWSRQVTCQTGCTCLGSGQGRIMSTVNVEC